VTPESRVESGRLSPIAREDLREPRRVRDDRPRRLHALSQVAQPPPRRELARLPRVIGQAARDLEEAEPPRRGRDLLRVLVRAAERDPRAKREGSTRADRTGRGPGRYLRRLAR
jgi:hypothetical protein